jgi:hypothetical protein
MHKALPKNWGIRPSGWLHRSWAIEETIGKAKVIRAKGIATHEEAQVLIFDTIAAREQRACRSHAEARRLKRSRR